MKVTSTIIVLIVIITLTGCVKKAQQSSADVALSTQVQTNEISNQDSNQANIGSTQAPTNMPTELFPSNARINTSTMVADGYQSTFSVNQTTDQLNTYYKGLNGWTVSAEFQTDSTTTISLEKSDQRTVVSITPKGTDSADVVVTGSFVKE